MDGCPDNDKEKDKNLMSKSSIRLEKFNVRCIF